MCDYKNGKIYQLVCNETREVYIGSTTASLEDRLTTHKAPTNNCYSKQIIDRNNYYIELLETYPCNNEFELNRKEGEYQRAIECINHNIAGRTYKEWVQDNKEKLDKYHKKYDTEYRQINKEAIAKRKHKYYQNNLETLKANRGKVVICECGIKSTHGTLKTHKLTKKHINLMNKLNLS